jgi:hypothetical protein
MLMSTITWAQNNNAYLDTLIQKQNTIKNVQCSVNVHVDVPGVNMPDKKIFLKYEQGKKPVIKSNGLLMMPKKGLFGQFEELLETPYQAIFLGAKNDTLMYKLVSMDSESDWVTTDIYFSKKDYRIFFLDITTREHGSFQVYHFYGKGIFPKRTEVRFESLPAKLPLKFLGRNKADIKVSGDEKIKGKVVLTYSDVKLNS